MGIGCFLEDLLRAMDGRDEWRESGNSVQSERLDDDDDDISLQFGLFVFNGISTFVGYVMPVPFS